ncbi:hypothetical protein GGR57DRAFT_501368 [Xylariaceae sp. FL1272]|nr:hypothetical protein GGR57DRAFT_501368 [Xylariaceae sp. FL1272]
MDHLRLRRLPFAQPITAHELLAERNHFVCQDKRQQTGWAIYYWARMSRVTNQHPDRTHKEIEKMLFDQWKSMSEDKQGPFCDSKERGPELDSDRGRTIRWERAIVQLANVLLLQSARRPKLDKLVKEDDFEGLCKYFNVTQIPPDLYQGADMHHRRYEFVNNSYDQDDWSPSSQTQHDQAHGDQPQDDQTDDEETRNALVRFRRPFFY